MIKLNELLSFLVEQEQKVSKLDFLKNKYVVNKEDKDKPKEKPQPTVGPNGEIVKPPRELKMSEEQFVEIVKNDPTSAMTNPDGRTLKDVAKAGAYVEWMIKRFFDLIPPDFKGKKDERAKDIAEKIRLFNEDLYKTKEDLIKFTRFKSQIQDVKKRDINAIKSFKELYELVKPFSEKAGDVNLTKAQQKLQSKEQVRNKDLKYLYEDDHWEVFIPLTPQASKDIGGPPLTTWCTASSSGERYHTNYSAQGPLYIIRDKTDIIKSGKGAGEPRPVYQFHLPSGSGYPQFKNKEDDEIDVVKFLNKQEGLKEFFRPIFQNAFKNRDFSLTDRIFVIMTSLWGTDKKTYQMILDILKGKLADIEQFQASDSDSTWSGFMSIMKEDFVIKALEHLNPAATCVEISWSNYTGDGMDIPETLGKFTEATQVMFSGFVKSLPKSIKNLRSLELISLPNNPMIQGLPDELAQIDALNLINISDIGADIQMPPTLQAKLDAPDPQIMII